MTIVYRDTCMLFTPMLPYASSGPIKPRKIAPPLFAILP
jgi:NADH dehydrogenase FAD-containing subunit